MRNKINIMERQEIPDEELERFKDFDALLNQHYRILNEKKPVPWKIIIPATILMVSIAVYWWMKDDPMPQTKQPVLSDTLAVAEEIESNSTPETVLPENKTLSTPKRATATPKAVPDDQPSVGAKTDSITVNVSKPASTEPVIQHESSDKVIKTETVYVQAEPVNGYESLYTYFSKELIYPEAAVKDSVEGVLMVKFMINKQGKPEKIQTSGTLGPLFDQEAIRLIEHMPLWKPATVNGQPITSKLSIPLTFQIRNRK